jgi:hypothetical protein
MCLRMDRDRHARVRGRGEFVQQQLGHLEGVGLESLPRPRDRGVHHPAVQARRTTGLARVACGPRERALRPAAHVGAHVDGLVERKHAGPARGHAHLVQVTERAAVRPEQGQRLGGRHGHGDRVEGVVLPPRVGLQFPAALALDDLVDADAALQVDVARHRSDGGAHAGLADVPVVDRCVPPAIVLEDARRPAGQHAGASGDLGVLRKRPTSGRDELRTVVEGQVALAARAEPAAQAARAFEHRDLRLGTGEFPGAGQA